MSILSEILAIKRSEVDSRKAVVSLHQMQERIVDAPLVRGFREALSKADGIAIIAEVKKASPSKGVIRHDFDPLEIARVYEANGATCLSVLTDDPYFQGKLEYLSGIRESIRVPLLRKDFIIDSWQIAESRAAGADAILLIVAALTAEEISRFLEVASGFGMDALVEVHDESEMEIALTCGANLIGINNRDLHAFRTSLATTERLLAEYGAAESVLFVSESGINTRTDVERIGRAGAKAALVGESMMREADIGAKLRELIGAS